MQLVVQNFPCYRDEATFAGQKVALYKRAQIVVADIDVLLCLKRVGGNSPFVFIVKFCFYLPNIISFLKKLSFLNE